MCLLWSIEYEWQKYSEPKENPQKHKPCTKQTKPLSAVKIWPHLTDNSLKYTHFLKYNFYSQTSFKAFIRSGFGRGLRGMHL